jgi:predicted nucleotidyltransferase
MLLMRPDRAWYRSELARELDVPPSSLQRLLGRLRDSGILRTRKDGNRVYYQADTTSPVYPELRGFLAKTSGLVDVLRSALEAAATDIKAAFVYGSVASGDEVATSDVDLLIVGPVRRSAVAGALREAGRQLGREVHPRIYSVAEFRSKRAAGDRFLRAVLDKPKLFVIGTQDDLGRASSPATSRTRADKPRGD